MSYYPPSNLNNIFNPIDFISPDEINDTTNDTTVDGNSYVKKSGDTMTGTLKVPQIEIDGTSQTVAYSSSDVAKLELNTTKLQNIIKTATHTEISDLKVPQLQFSNGISQTQPFTNTDKTKISENHGNIINMKTDIENNTSNIQLNTTYRENSIFYDYRITANESKLEVYSNSSTDVVFNRRLNIKDSSIIDITNSLSANNKFDGALSFLRTGSVYRKWWIGSIGDDVSPQNHFNICVNGNTAYPENVLDLSPEGNLQIKGDFLVGNNNKIIFNGIEQNQAYTNEDAILIQENATDIVDIKVKTDVIETVNSDAVYSRHKSFYRNFSTGSNVGYIGSVGDSLFIGGVGNNSIILNPSTGHIEHYCSNTYFGDNLGPGNIILQNQGDNTGSITIDNEVQKRAYTNELHAYYISKIEELTEQVNWLVFERIRQQKLDSVIAPSYHTGASTWIFNRIISTSQNTFNPILDYTSQYPNTSQFYGENL